MRLNLIPRVAAGDVNLGADRAGVARVLGLPQRSYVKGGSSPYAEERDSWLDGRLQVAYDTAGLVEYIELNGPGLVEAILMDQDLLSLPADAAVRHVQALAQYDPLNPELGYSFILGFP